MATRFLIGPNPTEPSILHVAWQHWFELLRVAVSEMSIQIDNAFTQISLLNSRVDSIETLGIDKLIVTSKAGFPTAAELRANTMSVWKNTATNEWRLWFLDGGSRYAFVLTPIDGPL